MFDPREVVGGIIGEIFLVAVIIVLVIGAVLGGIGWLIYYLFHHVTIGWV